MFESKVIFTCFSVFEIYGRDINSIEDNKRPTSSSEKERGDLSTYLWKTLSSTTATIPKPANEDKNNNPFNKPSRTFEIIIDVMGSREYQE